MGNYRFKLSDMIPNAWFYKLKDMSRAKKQINSNKKNNHLYKPRRSIHISSETTRVEKFTNSPENPKFSTTHFHDTPKKSSNRQSKRKTVYKPSPVSVKGKGKEYLFSSSESSDNEFYKSLVSETESNSIDGQDLLNEHSSWSSSCTCRVTSSITDIIIDMNENSSACKKIEKINSFNQFNDVQLRPILTKRSKQRKTSTGSRKSVSSSSGVKLKSNSPKIVSRKTKRSPNEHRKKSFSKSFSKSFAIVKSSFDPEKDFKGSMVEMIVENEISASKDLEELLACYLSLNSYEYHSIIINAFEQIWYEMASLRL